MDRRNILAGAAASLALAPAARAAPLTLRIVSSAHGRATDTAPAVGWTHRSFDDSAWRFARVACPDPGTPAAIRGGPAPAQVMGNDPPPPPADGGGAPRRPACSPACSPAGMP